MAGAIRATAVPTMHRPRLVDAAAPARIALVEAPGGYGKTTLAESVVAEWGLATVRVRFTVPADAAAAADLLLRALRRAGLVDLVAAATDGADADLGALLDHVVGELSRRDAPIAVLLDDVHRLDHEAAAAFADAGRDLAGGSHLVVTGRSLGPFADLTTAPGTAWIGIDDLRMTDDEIDHLLGELAGPALVEEVAMATGGWCAAVGLAVSRLRAEPTWSPSGAAGSRHLLGDLVAEALAGDPALVLLAQVPLVDVTVAAVLGGPGLHDAAIAAGILQRHPGGWSSVPDPIVEVAVTADVARPTHEQRELIAEHYRARGEVPAAVTVLGPASPGCLARFLARSHWTELEIVGSAELRRLCDALDDDVLRHEPAALVNVARAVELAQPPLRVACLARARRLTDPTESAATRTLDAEDARDLVAAARLDDARALARSVVDNADPGEHVARARALATIARLEVFECTPESLAEGGRLYADAAALLRRAGETRWLSETLARRGYTALYMAGEPVEGAAQMAEALALLPTGDSTRGFWLTNYADLMLYLGRVEEAEAAAAEAIEIGRRRHDESLSMMGWWSRSWIAARRGDLAACHAALAECDRRLGPWVRDGQSAEYHGSSAELLALLGDADGYRRHHERAAEIGEAIGYEVPATIARARFEAQHGDPAAALELMTELDGSFAVVPSNEPGRELLRALAQARTGDTASATATVERATRLAESFEVPDLLARYEAPVIAALQVLLGAEPTLDAADDAGTVHLTLLGGFTLLDGGADRTPPAGNPSTLVKLLALRGVMTTDAVIDALWPDAGVDTGRSRLRNLLNRLKERSGEVVVRSGDSVQLTGVTTDVDVFEHAAAEALSADPATRVGLARHAIALFPGPLLPGDLYEDWCAGPRERLKRRFLALIDLVADDALGRGDVDEAVRLLDLGIEAEPLDGSRYVVMCEALAGQGRRTAAREVAARGAAMLDEMGEPVPSELASHLAV